VAANHAPDAADLGSDGMTEAERDELRNHWRGYWRDSRARYAKWEAGCDAAWAAWRANPNCRPPRDPPAPDDSFPDILRGMTCGAKTRAGTPCKQISLYASGRCKFHGGMSTGPKTPEGKARSSRNRVISLRGQESGPH
jgi:hypothetical protein